jgi:hypothetical protein
MADLVVIVGVIAFFAVCVWFVWACDRIIGPDVEADVSTSDVGPERGDLAA